MQSSSADSSYHAECSKNFPAASAQVSSTMQNPQDDAHRPQKPAVTAKLLADASKQLTQSPAADHSQLPDAEDFSFYRPRARRLSEHGCGCCGLGLTLSSSPITETPAELQAAWAKMPVFWETETAAAAAPISEPVPDVTHMAAPAAGLSTDPSTELSTQRSFRITSPFAGLTLHIPDDQQDQQQQQQQQKVEPIEQFSGKHSSGSLSDAAAAALGSYQLVDDDGTPVPVFAIVSVSFSKAANPAVL
jgi:hypothetical protein